MKGKAENAKILGATLSAGVVTKQVLFFEQALLLTPLSGRKIGFYVFSDDMPQQIGNVFCCAYVRDAQNFFKKMWVKTFNTKFTFHFRSSN